jgi:beta-barrel assembly-enhancing protease
MAAMAQPATEISLVALARQEAWLLGAHYRLASAAADWCDAAPLTGILLRDVRQYDHEYQPIVRRAFNLAPDTMIYIAAIVGGSPAERAGLPTGGQVAAINGIVLDRQSEQRTRAFLDEAETAMATTRGDLRIALVDTGDWTLPPTIGCAANVQVAPGPDQWARADSRMISVPSSLFARVGEDGVTASVAHELAHIILRHEAERISERSMSSRARRVAAHAREFAADRLAIWLLRRGGYDPQTMIDLLRLEGQQSGNAERRFPRHPAWAERVRRAEAALIDMRERLARDAEARPDGVRALPPGVARPI